MCGYDIKQVYADTGLWVQKAKATEKHHSSKYTPQAQGTTVALINDYHE